MLALYISFITDYPDLVRFVVLESYHELVYLE